MDHVGCTTSLATTSDTTTTTTTTVATTVKAATAATNASGLLGLPNEVLWEIEAYLTTRDRAVCTQVCKAWHQEFFKDIWKSLLLRQCSSGKSIDFRAGPPYISRWRMIPDPTAFEILGRNLHWVNTLSIDLDTLHALTEQRGYTRPHSWISYEEGEQETQRRQHQPEQEGSIIQGLSRLEDLAVQVDHHYCGSSIVPLNLEPIIKTLQSATHLLKFTIQLHYKHACCSHDREMASLFRALPKSLEQLVVECLPNQNPKRFATTKVNQESGSIPLMETEPEILEKLKALYLFHCRVELNNTILKELLLPQGRCPALEELHVQVSPDYERYSRSREEGLTESLAKIISGGNNSSGEIDQEHGDKFATKRWKTMAFKRVNSLYMDNHVVAAILDSTVCASLENLFLDGCEAFDSVSIQRLLCSAPKLKRFSNLPSTIETDQDDESLPIEAFMLKAKDIVSSEWVCLELESFKCIIGGIPRPDVAERTNGWKLLFDLNNPNLYSMEDSRVVQRQVLAQLGRLTQLRELSLGKDYVEVEVYRCRERGCYGDYYCRFADMDHQLHDEDYCRTYMIDYDPAQQYQCLTLTLEDGLDLLEGLRAMKKFETEYMNIQKGPKEERWIQRNWPEYDDDWVDFFWPKRGYFDPLLEWTSGSEADTCFTIPMHTRTTLVDLPPEILIMICAYLTQHDRTVGVRVSRDWYSWLIDDLWHTVEIDDARSFPSRPGNYFRFKAACEAKAKGDDSGGNNAGSRIPPTLHRHLGRIRVLDVHHANTLALLSRIIEEVNENDKDKEVTTNDPQPFHSLLEFSAAFHEVPVAPRPLLPPVGFPPQVPAPPSPTEMRSPLQIQHLTQAAQQMVRLRKPIDLRPFLRIISQCHGLRRCTISIYIEGEKWMPGDQARLLASMPQSLEKLQLNSYGTLQIRHHRLERAEAETAVILAQISGEPLFAPNPVLLLSLKALTLSGMAMNMDVLLAFLERCPNLDELQVDVNVQKGPLARILTEGPRNDKGWRTLGFQSVTSRDITESVFKALLEYCAARLENLRIYGCGSTIQSKNIQRLLCSAPRLKRFDMIGINHDFAVDRHCLLAQDIVQSSKAGENWACLGLESFKCLIAGISRPDLLSGIDASDSTGKLQDFVLQKTQEDSRNLQRAVLAQFARLQELKEISLGPDLEVMTQDCFNDCCNSPEVMEYYGQSDPAKQYECLSLTLEDGLDQLKDLKSLRKLNIDKVSHRMGDKEHKWIRQHWPNYGREYKEKFWTERGHHVYSRDAFEKEHLFDWW